MAKRTPAPKSTAPHRPKVDAIAPVSVASAPRPAGHPSVADWMMAPMYLILALAFVPVSWLTGSKKAK